jgi:hypothetical protein
VDIFDGKDGTWHTAQLSVARYWLSATSLPSQGLALFAGGQGACVVHLISESIGTIYVRFSPVC